MKRALEGMPGFAHDFAVDARVRGLQERSIAAYLYDLRVFLDYMLKYGLTEAAALADITDAELGAVSYDALTGFLAQFQPQRAGQPQRAMLRKLASLNAVYKYLVRAGRIKANSAARIDARPAYKKVKPNPQSLDEPLLAAFLENVRSGRLLPETQRRFHTPAIAARDYAITILFLTSGLRLAELCGLRLGDVDFKAGRMRVLRKGGQYDHPPLHPLAASALLTYLPLRFKPKKEFKRQADEALFVSSPPSLGALTATAVWRRIKAYGESIDRFRYAFLSPHKLRHTFGQMLYDRTGDLYAVASALAHRQVDTARWYARVSEDRRRSVVEQLDLPG